MEPYVVLRVISLVVVWGIPAILVLAVVVFIILAPAFTFGGMASKLYEGVARRKRAALRDTALTIGEMLRAAKLPPEEEPQKAKRVAEKE